MVRGRLCVVVFHPSRSYFGCACARARARASFSLAQLSSHLLPFLPLPPLAPPFLFPPALGASAVGVTTLGASHSSNLETSSLASTRKTMDPMPHPTSLVSIPSRASTVAGLAEDCTGENEMNALVSRALAWFSIQISVRPGSIVARLPSSPLDHIRAPGRLRFPR